MCALFASSGLKDKLGHHWLPIRVKRGLFYVASESLLRPLIQVSDRYNFPRYMLHRLCKEPAVHASKEPAVTCIYLRAILPQARKYADTHLGRNGFKVAHARGQGLRFAREQSFNLSLPF